jgi:hypothetical protein
MMPGRRNDFWMAPLALCVAAALLVAVLLPSPAGDTAWAFLPILVVFGLLSLTPAGCLVPLEPPLRRLEPASASRSPRAPPSCFFS